MKKANIKEEVCSTYVKLVWDCTEKEFSKYSARNYNFQVNIIGAFGKCILLGENNTNEVIMWLKSKNHMDTISHEVLHLVKFWLNDYYNIKLNSDTEEIYTMLHSFYMREILIKLGKSNLISK